MRDMQDIAVDLYTQDELSQGLYASLKEVYEGLRLCCDTCGSVVLNQALLPTSGILSPNPPIELGSSIGMYMIRMVPYEMPRQYEYGNCLYAC
jgi:hypothetical protein